MKSRIQHPEVISAAPLQCRKLYADEKAKLMARRKSQDQANSSSAQTSKPKPGVQINLTALHDRHQSYHCVDLRIPTHPLQNTTCCQTCLTAHSSLRPASTTISEPIGAHHTLLHATSNCLLPCCPLSVLHISSGLCLLHTNSRLSFLNHKAYHPCITEQKIIPCLEVTGS